MNNKIRYAIVGLGHIAQTAVLPAFKHAENSELAALVTGNAEKDRELSERYRIKAYRYDDLESALEKEKVDAVYIATPNILHREHTERAAQAGVHVLCEKPMATTQDDCEAMMRAATQNNVKLMIAYRLHFNDANLHAVKVAKSGDLGDVRYFGSLFGLQVKEGNIRTRKDLGGGTLFDIGVYCINAARYLFHDEPIEVVGLTANNGEKRFAEIEEHDLLPVFLDGIVDEFQELFWANPAVWMENEREGSLFDHDGVQCRLPIGDGPRVVRPVRIVRLPIARGHRGEFPAEPAYHVGIGIIFNRCAEPFQTEPGHLVGLRGKVLMKLFPAVPVEHQLARQGLVIGRGDVHYR